MQIKQRLRINNAIMTASVVALIAVLLTTALHIRNVLERKQIADELVTTQYERLALRTDYMRSGSERAREQTQAKNRKVNDLLTLAADRFSDSDDRKIIEQLMQNQKSVGMTFRAILANHQDVATKTVNPALTAEIEDRLVSQLNMRVYEAAILGSKLQESSSAEFASTLKLAGILSILILLLVSTVTLINSTTMSQAIVARIGSLREGAELVGEGKLDHRTGLHGDDELAELSAAFDGMAAKLSSSYSTIKSEMEERSRAEEALQRREQEYRSLVESLPKTNIARFDDKRRFLFASPSIGEKFGIPAELMIGLRPSEVGFDPLFAIRLEEAISDVLISGKEISFQYAYMTAKSIDHREFTLIPEFVEQGQVKTVVQTSYDITDLKKLEDQLRGLTTTLEQRVQERTSALEAANKELEAFSYSVSHDLRAPLRSIDGFSRILIDKYTQQIDETGKDYLTRIRNAALRMGQLIDDMLHLSRIGRREMRKTKISLSDLAIAVVADLRQREPERQIAVDVVPGLVVTGDAGLLRIVLENLLGNASKFTGKKDDARIEVGATDKDGERVFYVKDNGAGFDMAYADKLFSPFQRLHKDTEFSGMGIGLATVQRIIARHGGHVWAKGEEGKGATFYFTLGDAS